MTLWARRYRKYPHEQPLIIAVKMTPHPTYEDNLCIDVSCEDCEEVLTFDVETDTAYCTNLDCVNDDVLILNDDHRTAIRITSKRN